MIDDDWSRLMVNDDKEPPKTLHQDWWIRGDVGNDGYWVCMVMGIIGLMIGKIAPTYINMNQQAKIIIFFRSWHRWLPLVTNWNSWYVKKRRCWVNPSIELWSFDWRFDLIIIESSNPIELWSLMICLASPIWSSNPLINHGCSRVHPTGTPVSGVSQGGPFSVASMGLLCCLQMFEKSLSRGLTWSPLKPVVVVGLRWCQVPNLWLSAFPFFHFLSRIRWLYKFAKRKCQDWWCPNHRICSIL